MTNEFKAASSKHRRRVMAFTAALGLVLGCVFGLSLRSVQATRQMTGQVTARWKSAVTAKTSTLGLATSPVPTTFTVTNTGDNGGVNPAVGAGTGTLRQAIIDANANAGTDAIVFALGAGTPTINVSELGLPKITDPVMISGNTGGSTRVALRRIVPGGPDIFANGLTISAGNSTIEGLEIYGFSVSGIYIYVNGGNTIKNCYIGGNLVGINLSSANNTIGGTTPNERNIISFNHGGGVRIGGPTTTGNKVTGNYIGTDVAGTTAVGNGDVGVFIVAAHNNTIGGASAGERNIISGNQGDGVRISLAATGNKVSGNYIGTDVTGTVALGNSSHSMNSHGVIIDGASNNTIGGTSAAERNLISGNDHGVTVARDATGNKVSGNYIGTDVTGTAALGNTFDGVNITDAPNNTIGGMSAGERNVISGNNRAGVSIYGTTGNKVMGNYIGTDVTGTAPLGNIRSGVVINSASNNTIGGTSVGARNIISGNKANGVYIFVDSAVASGNKVSGNYIGTDVTGTVALGNISQGVLIFQASHNTIGGTSVGERNVISGNGSSGVNIFDFIATGNKVSGNYIGTDVSGTAALGNTSDGVFIGQAPNNTVGGTSAGERNVIANNKRYGVEVAGDLSPGNTLLGNTIFNNTSLGIDLGGNGVTANDPLDTDTGDNNLQNFPVLSSAASLGSLTNIQGTLNSLATTGFRIEFFANDACDASGHGEGQTFLGFQNVTTDNSGNATLNFTVAQGVAAGKFITATATKLNSSGSPVETSEFSACRVVTLPSFIPAPTMSLVDPLACVGQGDLVNGSFGVANTTAMPQTGTVTSALPAAIVGLPDSCVANVGVCVVTTTTVTWTGTLAAGQTLAVSYQAQIADGTANGTQACAVTTAAFGVGIGTVQACLMVNCPTVGPGALPNGQNAISGQKPGSVLFYNLIASSATSPNLQNTRVSLTNVHPTRTAYVHLFLVDGSSCSVADSFVCLTANQTASFLLSDFDPGTTGYLVAVATDRTGCPINFNYLIGDEFVKLSSGHAANLAAESIAAVAGGLTACNANSTEAVLRFDNVSYNAVPRVLALDNFGSPADGNQTLLVVNRVGGSLATGASTLGTLFGVLYDDAEAGISFSLPGSCQLRANVSGTGIRTVPRIEQFIPAGRSGWLKLYSQQDIGLFGAALNFNPNAATSVGAFNQGHNLHKLMLSTAATYTIPVFPPSC